MVSAGATGLPGIVRFVEDLGASLLVSVELEGVTPLGVSAGGDDAFAVSRRHLKALLDGGLRLAFGDAVHLAVDPQPSASLRRGDGPFSSRLTQHHALDQWTPRTRPPTKKRLSTTTISTIGIVATCARAPRVPQLMS